MSTALVEKTFLLLESLADHGHPLALKDLHDRTGVPKSTAYRILQTLSNLGYVEQELDSGHYYITRRLANLAGATQYQDVIERATPVMQDLYAAFEETVNLGVLEGHHVSYLKVLETSKSLRSIVTPEVLDPVHSTALGRAIVAYLPEEDQKQLLASAKMEAFTDHTIVSKRDLKRQLEIAKRTGVAIEREENDVGVACFAIPIVERGRPVASISVSVPTVRLNYALEQSMIDALLDASETLNGATFAGTRTEFQPK